jgi:hypothetical protein
VEDYKLAGQFFDKGHVIQFRARDITNPGRNAISWRFHVIEDETVLSKATVHLSNTARAIIANRKEIDEGFLVCKRFVQWYRSEKRSEEEIIISSDNYEQIIPSEKADKLAVRRCVMETICGFYDEGEQFVSLFEILLSCDFGTADVNRALTVLTGKGWILPAADQGVYRLNQSKSDEFEEFLKRPSLPQTPHPHFQEVGIDVRGDFAFVIMPFREEEFPQRIYGDVIKPFVDDKFGIRPVRVDEDFTSQNILNKIYTYTLRSDFVIAEISTRNPNVMYELGLALALGKDVIVIENKEYASRTRWPERIFDIDKFPYYRYGDDKELQDSLDKAIIAHLSTRKK